MKYQVMIKPNREHTRNAQWQPLYGPRDTRESAEEIVRWSKDVDSKPPVGHYLYKIDEVEDETSGH